MTEKHIIHSDEHQNSIRITNIDGMSLFGKPIQSYNEILLKKSNKEE